MSAKKSKIQHIAGSEMCRFQLPRGVKETMAKEVAELTPNSLGSVFTEIVVRYYPLWREGRMAELAALEAAKEEIRQYPRAAAG